MSDLGRFPVMAIVAGAAEMVDKGAAVAADDEEERRAEAAGSTWLS